MTAADSKMSAEKYALLIRRFQPFSRRHYEQVEAASLRDLHSIPRRHAETDIAPRI
jgi:hypothetical protein